MSLLGSTSCDKFLYAIKAARLRRAARAARPGAGPRPAAGALPLRSRRRRLQPRRPARRRNTTSPGAADEQAAPRLTVTTNVLAGQAGSGMIVRHPIADQRRTRNLPILQGLATLGLRQTPFRTGGTRVRAQPSDGRTTLITGAAAGRSLP